MIRHNAERQLNPVGDILIHRLVLRVDHAIVASYGERAVIQAAGLDDQLGTLFPFGVQRHIRSDRGVEIKIHPFRRPAGYILPADQLHIINYLRLRLNGSASMADGLRRGRIARDFHVKGHCVRFAGHRQRDINKRAAVVRRVVPVALLAEQPERVFPDAQPAGHGQRHRARGAARGQMAVVPRTPVRIAQQRGDILPAARQRATVGQVEIPGVISISSRQAVRFGDVRGKDAVGIQQRQLPLIGCVGGNFKNRGGAFGAGGLPAYGGDGFAAFGG